MNKILILLVIILSIFNIFVSSSKLISSSDTSSTGDINLLYSITTYNDTNQQDLAIIDIEKGDVTYNYTFFDKDQIQSIISVDLVQNTVVFLVGNKIGTVEYLLEFNLETNEETVLSSIDFRSDYYVVVTQQVIMVNNVAYLNPFCQGIAGSGMVQLFAWDFNTLNFTATPLDLPDLDTKMGFFTIDPFLAYDNISDSFYTGYHSDIKGDNRLLIANYPRSNPTENINVYYNITDLNIQNVMKIFTVAGGGVIAATLSLDFVGTTRFCQIDFSTQTCETKLVLNMGSLYNNQPYVLNQDKTKLTLIISSRHDGALESSVVTYDTATWLPISKTFTYGNGPWNRVDANIYTYFYSV